MAVTLTMSYKVNSQSIENNSSNITVYVNAKWTGGSHNLLKKSGWCKIDGTKYEFTNSFNDSQTTSGQKTIFTKTVNVTHNSDGTKLLECSASYTTGVSSGTIAASFSEALTTIPRKSSISVGHGTLGTALTITVTRKSTSFTHTITAKCGSESTVICTKSSSTSIVFTPPLDWAKQNTTGTSVSATYTITTYNGSTNVGSETTTAKTYSIPASVKPSCSITVSDATSYYVTYGGYVKGYSKFKVAITPTLAHNSPIASYKASANGASYTTASFTTAWLKTSGTVNITASVTDKRGRTSSTATKSVTVLDYAPPKISKLTVSRCDSDGTANDQGEYAQVNFGYSISSLNNKNSATCALQYKKSTDTSYTTPSDFVASSGVYRFKADTGSSYDIKLTVTDKITKTTQSTSVSTAYTIMHWKANGRGMGIGKISEDDDVLDVDMHIHARNGITVDSDWIDLTLDSAFVPYNGTAENRPMLKATGNVVTIKGAVSPVTEYVSSTTTVNIASGIPAKYRPSTTLTFVCQGSGLNTWNLSVHSDGTIREARYGITDYETIWTSGWLTFTVTYQV